MTTAYAEPTPIRRRDVDAAIRASVQALIAGNGLTVEQVAELAGLSKSTLYNRLAGKSGGDFKAGEVDTLARMFGHTVDELINGTIRVGPGPGAPVMSLPHLDSNQKPAGIRLPPDNVAHMDDYRRGQHETTRPAVAPRRKSA